MLCGGEGSVCMFVCLSVCVCFQGVGGVLHQGFGVWMDLCVCQARAGWQRVYVSNSARSVMEARSLIKLPGMNKCDLVTCCSPNTRAYVSFYTFLRV